MKYQVNENGFYGEFGGAYVPEILYATARNLQEQYVGIIESQEFKDEYCALLRDYVGRPSPLYFARRMSEKYGCQLYLKREDLNHTGAHKINNTVGQILLAKKMGKTRIIAETGAGQHGVATATVCALMGMQCEVFMGATDVERQHTNVERMKMLGAKVHPVRTGNMTLSDACSEAIRDWCCHPSDTFYIVGSTMGPHPYPDLVARMQSIISEEIKSQLLKKAGRDYPDYLMACIGGGSNAAGTIYHYMDDERVRFIDEHTDGFIYMVSSASITGAQQSFDQQKQAYFRRIDAMHLRNPRMIGFGISNKQTLQSAQENAAGAIIGSKFVTLLDEAHGNADLALDRLFEALRS